MPSSSVHPHTRGEYTGVVGIDLDDCGSPPHAWGILPYVPLLKRPWRFTPTRVGNTPREADAAPWVVAGSPPHAWGIRARYPLSLRG